MQLGPGPVRDPSTGPFWMLGMCMMPQAQSGVLKDSLVDGDEDFLHHIAVVLPCTSNVAVAICSKSGEYEATVRLRYRNSPGGGPGFA